MTVDPAAASRKRPFPVDVEVLGTLRDGGPPQRAITEDVPAYLAVEGVSARLRYSPGRGADLWAPIEIISVFIGRTSRRDL